jgi:hypothetical protein
MAIFGPCSAKNKWLCAGEAIVQGIADGHTVKFPAWSTAVPRQVAATQSTTEVRQRANEVKAQAKARDLQALKNTMDRCRTIDLPANLDMLTRGNVGDGKAELGLQLIERFGKLHIDEVRDGRLPVVIAKTQAELDAYLANDGPCPA